MCICIRIFCISKYKLFVFLYLWIGASAHINVGTHILSTLYSHHVFALLHFNLHFYRRTMFLAAATRGPAPTSSTSCHQPPATPLRWAYGSWQSSHRQMLYGQQTKCWEAKSGAENGGGHHMMDFYCLGNSRIIFLCLIDLDMSWSEFRTNKSRNWTWVTGGMRKYGVVLYDCNAVSIGFQCLGKPTSFACGTQTQNRNWILEHRCGITKLD